MFPIYHESVRHFLEVHQNLENELRRQHLAKSSQVSQSVNAQQESSSSSTATEATSKKPQETVKTPAVFEAVRASGAKGWPFGLHSKSKKHNTRSSPS